jgi:DNA-binding NarL/FixJ family response regulator
MGGPLRVLLVGSDPLARAGLAGSLGEQSGCEVVGQVDPDLPAVEALPLFRPEVVIWDLGWTADPGLDSRGPDRWGPLLAYVEAGAAVLVLLGGPDTAAELWAGGVRGLLSRQTSGPGLEAAAKALAQGWAVVDPSLAEEVPWAGARPRPESGPLEELTGRELEVLQLLAEGLPNKSIALRLAISEHTVKFHVNAILRKLVAQSRTEAVVRATRLGLILL